MIQLPLFNEEPAEKYSIAICPDDTTVSKVDNMKTLLAERIGNYRSRNAKAHISFFEIELIESELERLEQKLSRFCHTQTAFEIHLNHTATFSHGTFYLGLNEASKMPVIKLRNELFKALSLRTNAPFNPHMSIARTGLTKPQLTIATEAIKDVDLKFVCDSLCIRRFNRDKGQYDIYRRMMFSQNGV